MQIKKLKSSHYAGGYTSLNIALYCIKHTTVLYYKCYNNLSNGCVTRNVIQLTSYKL